MGLVNRIAEPGAALDETLELAADIARFPQAGMRSDRRASLEQWDLSLEDALANEFRLGMESVATGETAQGAARFAGGKGRHGDFADL